MRSILVYAVTTILREYLTSCRHLFITYMLLMFFTLKYMSNNIDITIYTFHIIIPYFQ